MKTLLSPVRVGRYELRNRIVMAPMTRCRAIGNVPNELMARYYQARAAAGLLITEGTAPSPNGLGYARIPGCYTAAQADGWRAVAQAVHERGGRIFMQLIHTGRAAHELNMPPGAQVVAPSAIPLSGKMWTDSQGEQPYPTPREMTLADIKQAQQEFVRAAERAVGAGIDGVELHGANGYLLDQFLNPCANTRTDSYGGSATNRRRFMLEGAQQVAAAIGADRVGIRLSPYGRFNDMQEFAGQDGEFEDLARELGELRLAYLHLTDQGALGLTAIPESLKSKMRSAFGGAFILSGGYDGPRAEADLSTGKGDLVAFGRPFISNPDLVQKLAAGTPLRPADASTFYTPGEAGYSDYPTG